MASRCKRESCYALTTWLWNKVIWHELTQLSYRHYNLHPGRLTWTIMMEVWFRSFSFPNGWFVGSMLIFQGVYDLLSPLWSGPGVQGPLHWLPRTPARSHPSGPPLSWFLRFWTDGPAINSTQMPGAHRQSWDWMLKISYIDIHRTSGSLNGEMQQNNNTPSPHAFESNTKPPGASQNVHCAPCISTLGNL